MLMLDKESSSSGLSPTTLNRDFVPVGGHDELFSPSPGSDTGHSGPCIIRKLVKPREAAFYLGVLKVQMTDKSVGNVELPCDAAVVSELERVLPMDSTHLALLAEIQPVIPQCYGVVAKGGSSVHQHEVIFQNVAHRFRWPCVMDIKVGTKYHTYYTDVVKATDLERRANLCTTGSIGLRITQFRGFFHENGEVVDVERDLGRRIASRAEFVTVVQKYLALGDEGRRRKVCHIFLQYLQRYEQWFNRQTAFTFRQSSLLFVFDSLPDHWTNPIVRLIDFSHVVLNEAEGQPKGIDEGVLVGIQNLMSIFEEVNSNGAQMKAIEKAFGPVVTRT